MGESRRANVIGLGLIGGSVAAALHRDGWTVTGVDVDAAVARRAVEVGVVDRAGHALDAGAELTVIAVPVTAAPEAVARALAETAGLVTDVASVKGSLCRAVSDPRFVPGHPMAGSERHGLDGADPDMFRGAVWVLCPTGATADASFTAVAAVVRGLGAEVVTLRPDDHDAVVAVVSHVPHLAAASLMTLADRRSDDHASLLRLAAGGFRDMTRIASGHPAIWPDICAENREAIVAGLDELIDGLGHVRALVQTSDRSGIVEVLERARLARNNLPVRATRPDHLAEIRVPIPDRPGAAAGVFTLAGDLGVNIESFEVVHSAEGPSGIAILLIDAEAADGLRSGLIERGYRPSLDRLQ